MISPIRSELIAAGVLRPRGLAPDPVGRGLPFLPLDPKGAIAAAEDIARPVGRRKDAPSRRMEARR